MSLFGLGMLFENVIVGIFIFLFGAFILIGGALVTVMCYVTTFSVEGSGGHTGKIFEFWYKEKTKLESLSDEVNSLLANQQSKLTSV